MGYYAGMEAMLTTRLSVYFQQSDYAERITSSCTILLRGRPQDAVTAAAAESGGNQKIDKKLERGFRRQPTAGRSDD